ncbi:PA26 p53-induced protein-domain-containing protein [Mucor mucedo]|uniref:PA26 p53-induced protein-domain-containing protein n=1 Tax=Mucor mucedo TaxID=29922 RepID=UPI00221E3A0A|nr:PA26 p53-induced protein-domain-containing protein [Mucor mucedo]KAI7891972.1 PA26 p53-induced protein-domain-containing protein [Mucor mucedo]
MNQEDPNAETIRDCRASQLQSCRQRIALFKGLQVDNYEDRGTALEKIIQVVKSYIRSSLSPSITTSPTLSDHSVTDHILNNQDDEYSKQLFYYLLTILRLSITCPYADVRQTFKDLLIGLKETTSIAIPQAKYKSPSHFIPIYDIFSLESNTSTYQQAAVLYPRSSNLSFSPWSYTNSLIDEEEKIQLQKKQQEEDDDYEEEPDPSMPTTATTITPTMKPIKQNSICSSIHSNDFTGGRPSDEYVRQMMIKTFTDEGRLANLFRVLSFFPTFFEIYHITFTKIIKGNMGPLHRTWKTYIGLMVAAEQQCQYMFSVMKIDFLYNGGDPNWLRGLDFIPQKLRQISVLVLKLSRQPWRLNTDDIMNLLTGGVGDAWTRGELVQATLIISTFLGLSSFVMGCGITPEIDMTGGFYIPTQDCINGGIENELDLPYLSENNAMAWHQQDDTFSSDHGVGLGVSTLDLDLDHTQEIINKLKSKKNCDVKEQLLESLEKMKIQDGNKMSINTSFNTPRSLEETQEEPTVTATEVNKIYDDLKCFVDPILSEAIVHEEFDQENEEYMEFMLGEYCWEDHGCDLANHFLPGIGDDLVQEFTEAISITDWSIFHPVVEDVVDTSPLRYAIWYHTQKIMGVTKEDYTYSDIPTFLNDRTTKYIHSLCMSPHKIQKNDWCNIGISLRPEEKCHVNLLVASARKQAVLCYGLCLISEV